MASNHSDADQVEALKEWWKENGRSVIAGVVIGLGSLFGWKGWNVYQQSQAQQASSYYSTLQQALVANDTSKVASATDTLRDTYASTPYAAMAALAQAKLTAEQGDLKASTMHLEWVLENTQQQSVRDIARIRLARLMHATKDYDQALILLDEDVSPSYASLVSEIRGDTLAAKGQIEEARAAYDQALIDAQGDTEFLRMKRDELASSESDAAA